MENFLSRSFSGFWVSNFEMLWVDFHTRKISTRLQGIQVG